MISVIISYCNNDFKFIEENISEAKKFSDDIIIVFCKHSFDGEREDIGVLNKMIDVSSGCRLCEIPFKNGRANKYHHNLMRFEGKKMAKNDYVLFLDADEIMEGELFRHYLSEKKYLEYDVISFKCYWYFRERQNRAVQTEQAAVLCKKEICDEGYIFSEAERWEFFNRKMKFLENETFGEKVLCHHYSWVKTKDEMLKKVRCWGHRDERNWVALIEEEFKHEFRKTDFVHNYNYI